MEAVAAEAVVEEAAVVVADIAVEAVAAVIKRNHIESKLYLRFYMAVWKANISGGYRGLQTH